MGWLYFEQLAAGGRQNCKSEELYADAIWDAYSPGVRVYFQRCPNTPSTPSATTRAVTRSILDGEVPEWFKDEYDAAGLPYSTSDDPKYDHDYDLERVWAAVKNSQGYLRHPRVAMFRGAFGGYCSDARATQSVFYGGSTRNPWRAGGCVPQTPSLSATVVSGDLNLSWTKPAYDGGAPITKYLVEWQDLTDPSARTESKQVDPTTTGGSHTISGLDSAYEVRVRARNPNGLGAIATLRLASAPGQPGNLRAAGDAELDVAWDAPGDGGSPITGYTVQWKSGAEMYDAVTRSATVTTTSHTIPTLTNGTEYTLQVQATNAEGAGDWVEIKATPRPGGGIYSVVVADFSEDAATATVSLANPDASAVMVHLRYRQADEMIGCAVPMMEMDGEETPELEWVEAMLTTSSEVAAFPLSGLAAEADYCLETDLDGDYAAGALAQEFTTPSAADPPTDPMITGFGDGELSLSWSAPVDASAISGYLVQWKSGQEEYDATRQTETTGTALTVTDLRNGAVHTLRVRAVNTEGGQSRWSDEVSGTPLASPVSGIVVSPLDASSAQAAVGLAVTDHSGVRLRHRPEGGSVADWVAATPDGEVFRLDGLQPDHGYELEATVEGGLASGYVHTETFTMPTKPDAPTGVAVAAAASGQIVVSWEPPPDSSDISVSFHRVQWKSETDADYDPVGRSALVHGLDSHTLTGLENGKRHTVRVIATNVIGDSLPWEERSATPEAVPIARNLSWSTRGRSGEFRHNGYCYHPQVGSASCVDDVPSWVADVRTCLRSLK